MSVDKDIELLNAATRRLHEAIKDAKEARSELRETVDEARRLLGGLNSLAQAIAELDLEGA